jgi:hypothetical protein
MTDSQTLLADYATNGSEPAFRELISRYLNVVYSTAVRLVGGDTHLAQDAAQTVFVNLDRKACTLPRDVMAGARPTRTILNGSGFIHRTAGLWNRRGWCAKYACVVPRCNVMPKPMIQKISSPS